MDMYIILLNAVHVCMCVYVKVSHLEGELLICLIRQYRQFLLEQSTALAREESRCVYVFSYACSQ